MPTLPTSIWLALKSRIDTLQPEPDMPVYEPDATVSNSGPFILVSDVRAEPVRVGIGGDVKLQIFSGTLMLAIHYPIASPASYTQITQMAGVIAEHFPTDLRMKYGIGSDATCLRVTAHPDVQQPYRDGDRRVCVVRVPWTSM